MTEPSDSADRIVQYRKFDGSPHWRHDAKLLGQDEHGIWLGAGPYSRIQRADEPAIAFSHAYVQLIPAEARWTAIFNGPGAKYQIYVDLTTAAEWIDETTVEMIDLDLDVVRRDNGQVELLDEDEFDAHTLHYGYPDDLVAQTRADADEVLRLVTDRVEPFDRAGQNWLTQVL